MRIIFDLMALWLLFWTMENAHRCIDARFNHLRYGEENAYSALTVLASLCYLATFLFLFLAWFNLVSLPYEPGMIRLEWEIFGSSARWLA